MAALFQELEVLGWTACRNVEIDVRLAARATAAVKNNSLRPERPHPQLKRDLLCDTPSRGNDGLPRNFCSAGPTPNLRPRPLGGGTGDHSHARVPGQRTPLRPSVSFPLAAAPGRAI